MERKRKRMSKRGKAVICGAGLLTAGLFLLCIRLQKPAPALPASLTENTLASAETESIQTVVQTAAQTAVTETQQRAAGAVPESYTIPDVPHLYQKDRYPTGCESVAAVSLLQFYGIEITVDVFIDEYLPKADYPYYEGDVMYGDSPWEYFIGDPYSKSGYGCYAPPIAQAMNAAQEEFSAEILSDVPLEELCGTYIANDHPVLIWATMYMKTPEEGHRWRLPDGEEFIFMRPEHALLLVGYDEEHYYFSDSLSEDACTAYPKADCEAAYAGMYSQAIVAGQN